MNRTSPSLIVALAAMAFVTVAVHGVIEYRATRAIIGQFAEAQQDSDTVVALDQVLDDAANGDAGGAAVHLRRLERLTAAEPQQQRHLQGLRVLVEKRLRGDRQVMRAIRSELDAMRVTEEQERAVARAIANRSSERVLDGIEVSTSVAGVLLLLTFLQFGIAARANQSANRLKDQFLATVSHELRTPLTAILGWSAILREESTDRQLLQDGLAAIERSASVQRQLVEDMLDVSRVQAGKLRLTMRTLDLTEAVRTAIDSMRPEAGTKSISIVTELDPCIEVSGDPDRLQQIVWNLMTNAVKFTPRGGQITASVSRAGAHAVIEVRDSGEGIDAAFLPHVFEPFRQSDSSRARLHKGLGLGLSIVKYLVEAHGGTVSVASEGEGQGTTFRVSLPVTADRHGDPSSGPSGHLLPTSGEKGTPAITHIAGPWSSAGGIATSSDGATRGPGPGECEAARSCIRSRR
jgi:signal transduction histidine kinase